MPVRFGAGEVRRHCIADRLLTESGTALLGWLCGGHLGWSPRCDLGPTVPDMLR